MIYAFWIVVLILVGFIGLAMVRLEKDIEADAHDPYNQ